MKKEQWINCNIFSGLIEKLPLINLIDFDNTILPIWFKCVYLSLLGGKLPLSAYKYLNFVNNISGHIMTWLCLNLVTQVENYF